jgi:hypothetical protein
VVLDWSARPPSLPRRGPVDSWFRRVNRSSDGQLTREEWNKFFDEAAGSKNHLTAADLREAFAGPAARIGASVQPSQQVLVRGMFRGEVGSIHEGPRINDPAPDFNLRHRDGKGVTRLSDLFGKKPIVLTFGNFTCSPFRATYPHVEELISRYKDDAVFLAIYVREAHPTDGWRMASNDAAGVTVAQPKDYAERITVANTCSAKLKMSTPLLVDEIDDRVGHTYSGMPSRLYLIDSDGRVAYRSGRGPFGFKPAELEQSLVMLLLEQNDKNIRSRHNGNQATK